MTLPTLAHFRSGSYDISLHCGDCRRSATVHVDEMIRLYGEQATRDDILRRASCSGCGSHDISLTVSAARLIREQNERRMKDDLGG